MSMLCAAFLRALGKGAAFALLVVGGAWPQAANACADAHGVRAETKEARETVLVAKFADAARIGADHRCECPAAAVGVQFIASDLAKSLHLQDSDESGGFPIFSSADLSRLLAARTEASFSAGRALGRPRYLLALRLRQ